MINISLFAPMRYEVKISTYGDERVRMVTRHRSLAAAIKSARSIIGGRKHRIRTLKTCVIWDSNANTNLTVSRAEEVLKQDCAD